MDSAAASRGSLLKGYCERCGYEVYGVGRSKFCPVPTCRGYIVHIDRGAHRG